MNDSNTAIHPGSRLTEDPLKVPPYYSSAVAKRTIFFLVICTLVAFSSGQSDCQICGDGFVVGTPDAVFAYPGQPEVP